MLTGTQAIMPPLIQPVRLPQMMAATAKAHPNVALIKYWGKRDSVANLPAVGSLSIVMGALNTTTTVQFQSSKAEDRVILNGSESAADNSSVTRCLDKLRHLASVDYPAVVTTSNDFPTGAGLASSASGYAALVTAAAGALDLNLSPEQLSELARTGSGSAPRSLFGGFALLRNQGDQTTCVQIATPEEWPLAIVIAVTSDEEKAVSSRVGMELSRQTSPYYQQWINTHDADLEAGLRCVQERDFAALAVLAEHSCLKMHAVMMATRPSLLYLSAATMACLNVIRDLRQSGTDVFFTVDAGPQVKAVCTLDAVDQVASAMEEIPGVLKIIISQLGAGARLITPDGQ